MAILHRGIVAALLFVHLSALLPTARAAPDSRYLIVPGSSIGPVRLDMTFTDAYDAMVRTWPGILLKEIVGPKNSPPCSPTAVVCTPTRLIWVSADAGVLSFDTYGRFIHAGVFMIAVNDERYTTASGLRRGVSKARALKIMGIPMKSIPSALWWKLWWGIEFVPAHLCWSGLCVSLDGNTVSSVIVYE